MAAQAKSPVEPGQILAGRYRIDRVLGVGGMGVVVSASHVLLPQRVAIKFLLPHALENPETVTRFTREAQNASQLRGEHVARVLDIGLLDSGAPYMVMEHLEGSDLGKLVDAQGPLPVADAVDALLQTCVALAEAHAHGIVHRDLKPTNLFRTQRPDGSVCIKVLDFGISKLQTATQVQLTATQGLLGSPLYMSPEQIRLAREVDARTDIWSLGVVLYELLTGTPPFLATTLMDLSVRICTEPFDPIEAKRPGLPRPIVDAIASCLQKNRDHRFASVAALAAVIAPYGGTDAARMAEASRTTEASRAGSVVPDQPHRVSSAIGKPPPGSIPAAFVDSALLRSQPTEMALGDAASHASAQAARMAPGAVVAETLAISSDDHAAIVAAARPIVAATAVSAPAVGASTTIGGSNAVRDAPFDEGAHGVPRSRAPLIGGVFALLAAVTIAGVAMNRSTPSTPASESASEPEPEPTKSKKATDDRKAAPPSVPTAASASVESVFATPSISASTPPRPPPIATPRPVVPPSTRPSDRPGTTPDKPVAKPPPAPDCDPPFFYDKDGNKVRKPACN